MLDAEEMLSGMLCLFFSEGFCTSCCICAWVCRSGCPEAITDKTHLWVIGQLKLYPCLSKMGLFLVKLSNTSAVPAYSFHCLPPGVGTFWLV